MLNGLLRRVHDERGVDGAHTVWTDNEATFARARADLIAFDVPDGNLGLTP